jgi:hypothetical protein
LEKAEKSVAVIELVQVNDDDDDDDDDDDEKVIESNVDLILEHTHDKSPIEFAELSNSQSRSWDDEDSTLIDLDDYDEISSSDSSDENDFLHVRSSCPLLYMMGHYIGLWQRIFFMLPLHFNARSLTLQMVVLCLKSIMITIMIVTMTTLKITVMTTSMITIMTTSTTTFTTTLPLQAVT